MLSFQTDLYAFRRSDQNSYKTCVSYSSATGILFYHVEWCRLPTTFVCCNDVTLRSEIGGFDLRRKLGAEEMEDERKAHSLMRSEWQVDLSRVGFTKRIMAAYLMQ
jgi:hypothetical protein